MPFSSSGITPDIIINPHAIPSRMTIAQLKENLLGKVLVELGLFGDGTSFGELDVNFIKNELLKCGYEQHGNELLYNGLTGEQLESSIFIDKSDICSTNSLTFIVRLGTSFIRPSLFL